tara:strand:- start:109 stop:288 length:180 start_codon:yes stop_codon:yes gene_type:complete
VVENLVLFIIEDGELDVVTFVGEGEAESVVFDAIVLKNLVLSVQFQGDEGVVLEIELAA